MSVNNAKATEGAINLESALEQAAQYRRIAKNLPTLARENPYSIEMTLMLDEIEHLRAKVNALRIVVMNAQTALGSGDILPHDEHVLAKRITSARRALNG